MSYRKRLVSSLEVYERNSEVGGREEGKGLTEGGPRESEESPFR